LAWIRLSAGSGATLAVRLLPGDSLPATGERVSLRPLPGHVHAFDATGATRSMPAAATPSGEVATTPSH
jgi:hypothetical protein